ncbi:MAG: ribose-phosphate pyrophosphokinase [Gluconacetobacter diazotrophicus]|nr:ribose-phosphate pyrophosphokinase [Gluconacetobacter diazotrophicus]
MDDPVALRRVLQAAAAASEVVSYGEALRRLGHRFTRPKMRQLCRTLGMVDATRAAGEPELAVLVVRASDGMPGAGWRGDDGDGVGGEVRGAEAVRDVEARQGAAFKYWSRKRLRKGATT